MRVIRPPVTRSSLRACKLLTSMHFLICLVSMQSRYTIQGRKCPRRLVSTLKYIFLYSHSYPLSRLRSRSRLRYVLYLY